jgi:signal transduction histidine kinase
VELQVRDSGVGFPPTEGRRLFQKFTRLRSGAGYYGTGLGLYIVRRLMELAHGRVSAHSDGVGQGASVRLTWPAAPVGAGPQPAAGQEMRP